MKRGSALDERYWACSHSGRLIYLSRFKNSVIVFLVNMEQSDMVMHRRQRTLFLSSITDGDVLMIEPEQNRTSGHTSKLHIKEQDGKKPG